MLPPHQRSTAKGPDSCMPLTRRPTRSTFCETLAYLCRLLVQKDLLVLHLPLSRSGQRSFLSVAPLQVCLAPSSSNRWLEHLLSALSDEVVAVGPVAGSVHTSWCPALPGLGQEGWTCMSHHALNRCVSTSSTLLHNESNNCLSDSLPCPIGIPELLALKYPPLSTTLTGMPPAQHDCTGSTEIIILKYISWDRHELNEVAAECFLRWAH